MRVIEADIGNSGEIHKLYQEYTKDLGKMMPKADFWLMRFRDPTFFLLLAKHGKKPVGFVMGNTRPYFDVPTVEFEAFFIRRSFRKFKFVRSLADDAKGFLKHLNIETIVYNRTKPRERKL